MADRFGVNWDGVRIIVYDLDGTVYDDNRHFEIYARLMQRLLPVGAQAAFWADYLATVAGNHPALTIGCFYDRERDLVLRLKGGKVAQALRWDGSAIPEEACRQWYPASPEPDQRRIINVGDLWWAPGAVLAHHGGDLAKSGEAFLQVRETMADPGFEIRSIPGLRETISALRGRFHQVLVTNSPQPDSEAILRKVGLLGLLDDYYFMSRKPVGLQAILEELAHSRGVDMAGILSIGDNLVNEISPAKALGCQTIFIDAHGFGEPGDADLIVRSMGQLIPQLQEALLRP